MKNILHLNRHREFFAEIVERNQVKKNKSKKAGAPVTAMRELQLHGKFWPGNPDLAGFAAFMEFWAATQSYLAPAKLKGRLRKKIEGSKSEKVLKAAAAFSDAVSQLNELAAAGDEEAAEALATAANLSVLALTVLEKTQPEIMGRLARADATWPVLTDGKPGWERKAAQNIAKLDVGADLHFLKTRFRQPRGAEVNLPARTWAKAAVRTIEETRWRLLAFGHMLNEFGSPEAFTDYCLKNGWNFTKNAGWVDEVTKLGVFSVETLPAWKRAIRKLVREQLPEFHSRPEWATQRESAIARARGTSGEIQNAILDDITSALERLAPPAQLPRPTC